MKNLFHRPALKLGDLGKGRRSASHLRTERFASYLAASNSRRINTDLQDTMLMVRRLLRHGLVLGALVGLGWIVVESAQAVGVF